MPENNVEHGKKLIQKLLKDTPATSGVYFMANADQQVIYIGKAKNLKKRLTNYIAPGLRGRISRMVHQVCSIEYQITESEAEAFLVEANLIRKFQPRFNILLRRNKSFTYIKLRLDHDFPQFIKYRSNKTENEILYGPFISGYQTDIVIEELQKIFRLRTCIDSYFISRERPCLQYQIGKCFAPCTGEISIENYNELINQAKDFLSGKTEQLLEKLANKMQELSNNCLFEEAAIIRDRIKTLKYSRLNIGEQYTGIIDADVIALAKKHNKYCIGVLLYRGAQKWGEQIYFPIHTEESQIPKVLESFIGQFYQTRKPPKEIIINYALIKPQLIIEALKTLYNVKVKIIIPQRGKKAQLLKNIYKTINLALSYKYNN
ncbi:excinuclease ABC subunit UvrC [Rickettsia endosymbiont of Halotydeus destructor]|uniref:excinuclease ABC subunit UvrC n=1 Tax=Rickettsia endosymbiont of Halotydeus destructor TaxID=2996754 RepID=UPI003BAF5C1A